MADVTRPREVTDGQGKMWRLLPDLGLQVRIPGTLAGNEWREAEGWELAAVCESRHVVADLLVHPTKEQEGRMDSDRLDGLEWFGCMTGDCPHETQAECDAAILAELRSVLAERAEAMK